MKLPTRMPGAAKGFSSGSGVSLDGLLADGALADRKDIVRVVLGLPDRSRHVFGVQFGIRRGPGFRI